MSRTRPVGTWRRARLGFCLFIACALVVVGLRQAAPVAAAQTTTFTNATSLTIPTGPGGASLYPDEIVVAGLTGTVGKVTVTLNDISHTFPADLDIVLVGPNGGNVLFLSDNGGTVDFTNLNLTFDDEATQTLPQGVVTPTSGTYRPLNIDSNNAADTLVAPAPVAPYGASFGGAFNGSDPNGTWQLYIYDDLAGDGGSVAGGWSLTITTGLNTTTTTTTSVGAASGTYGGTTALTATLAAGGPLSGQPVAFTVNGAAACGTGSTPACPLTDAGGVATLPGVSLAGIPGGSYPTGVGASFAGDATYAPSNGTAALTVNPVAQAITFNPNPLPNRTFGDAPFAVAATASSGLPVGFSAGPSGVCATTGADNATIVFLGAGSCTVTATQPGDASFQPAAPVARSFTVALPPTGVTVTAIGPGAVNPGTGNYPRGTLNLTATPSGGALFTGWVVDGQRVGWNPALTLTVAATPRTVAATFANRPAFADVSGATPTTEAIGQLAARGIIKGYGDGRFGPNDPLARAQIAALIVRGLQFDNNPTGPPPFSDLAVVDAELQRAIAILALNGVAKGFGDGTFAPTAEVRQVQVISFIARAMVAKGYWTAVTGDDPSIYANVPLASGNRLDLLTFVKYAGALPDRPTNQGWADWAASANRGWTARVLWQALDGYFKTNRVP